ncbi:MAG: hypothetical protein E7191_03840 [Erysipelotrichaceae bacterium]|nr:hypothetical protein [Erysipelotrichaceae bacterium]
MKKWKDRLLILLGLFIAFLPCYRLIFIVLYYTITPHIHELDSYRVIPSSEIEDPSFCEYIQTEKTRYQTFYYYPSVYRCHSSFTTEHGDVVIYAYNQDPERIPFEKQTEMFGGRGMEKLVYVDENTFTSILGNGIVVEFYQYDLYFEDGDYIDRNTKFNFFFDDIYYEGSLVVSNKYEDSELNTFTFQESEASQFILNHFQ